MSVGYANGIRVMSMTHTGEPGFMLYIPIEVSATGRGWGCAEINSDCIFLGQLIKPLSANECIETCLVESW